MIQKAALTNLTKSLALFRFNEARAHPGAVVELLEQANGLWTVTIVWDNAHLPVTFQDLEAFDETMATAPDEMPLDAEVPGLAHEALGQLSRKFESNGKPGAIGFDTKGGFSYGAYQIATKTGTMQRFLQFSAQRFPAFHQKLQTAGGVEAALAGNDSFKDAWMALAADASFATAQHDYIEETHYRPFAKKLQDDLGLDLNERSAVLRDVAWSVAVQHGPMNSVFGTAVSGANASTLADSAFIPLIYAERAKVEKYFPSSSVQVKKALVSRFREELEVALARLA